MPTVLVPLALGFEELEAVTVIDLLRRGGVEVVVAGVDAGPVTASRRVTVVPDVGLNDVLAADFDMVVLPGGIGAQRLEADERIARLLQRQQAAGRYAAAICAAPRVLAAAGLLEGRTATAYPGTLDGVAGVRVSSQAVVQDGRIITSRGPGTAMDFALTLVEVLCGRDKRNEVEKGLQRG
ncbi:MAG: DJ-1/PfpI family protein [Pseudomonadota bacterium]|nr:DJ-1/PfpI family protein [Pseudomonadota bacterium]